MKLNLTIELTAEHRLGLERKHNNGRLMSQSELEAAATEGLLGLLERTATNQLFVFSLIETAQKAAAPTP